MGEEEDVGDEDEEEEQECKVLGILLGSEDEDGLEGVDGSAEIKGSAEFEE